MNRKGPGPTHFLGYPEFGLGILETDKKKETPMRLLKGGGKLELIAILANAKIQKRN
jgi:hypothetical protein